MILALTFATPLLLLGLLASLIPLALHLLSSVRAQETYFPTLRFLQRSMEKTARRRRIQHWLLLLLRMGLLAMLAMSVSEPISDAVGGWFSGRRYATVIVLDNSLSMAARSEATSRFDRARTEATESLRAEGTVLVRLKNEKHFLHFQACYRRPDHSRLDVDLEGPLGLGRGRLTIVRRGRNVDLRHPEGEIERTVLGSESLAFLDTYGLSPATVPYLVAPYTGTADLFDEERLVTSGRDGRTGSLRVVLRRDDGLREVLLVDPDRFDLTERRIVEAGGTVRILFRYLYDEGGEGPASILLPREVETRVPAEEADLRARFRKKERNIDISDTVFFVR